MKILLVSPLPPPEGGIATWTKLLLANWPQDFELILCNSATRISKRYPGIMARIVRGMKKCPRELLQIYSLAKKNRIDICHVATSGHLSFFRDILIAILMRALGKKSVFHMRFGRLPQLCRSRNWESFLLSMLFRNCDGIIAIDLASFTALRDKFGPQKIFHIPNFIDLKEIPVETDLNRQRMPGRIFFSGHIHEEKGIRELFEACNEIPQAKLVLAGKCTDEFKSKLLGRYPAVNCEFLGIVPKAEVIRQLLLCDIFAFPSYTEGFPNSVAEAMGCGCAIAATPVGAIPEMLNADSADACGILVAEKDSVSLRNALLKMLSDRELCRELGRRARKRVESEYSETIVPDKLGSIWKILVTH